MPVNTCAALQTTTSALLPTQQFRPSTISLHIMTQMHTQMTLPLLQAMSPNSPVSPTPPGVANLAMQSMTALLLTSSNTAAFQVIFLLVRGPISWKSIRQNGMSLSSCKAEIIVTNTCVTELEHTLLLLP